MLKNYFLIFLWLLPLSLVAQDIPVSGDIIINEIFYNPPGNDDLEFIELYNNSNKTFNLSQFRFKDATATIRVITETAISMPPNSYRVLAKDKALLETAFPGITVIQPPSWPSLNNTGDEIELFFQDGTQIDFVSYQTSWGGATDISLERIDPNGASNNAVNWGSCIHSLGATPTQQNSIYNPDVTPPLLLLAEQLSPTEILLLFNEPLDENRISVNNFQLGGTIPSQFNFGITTSEVHLFFASTITSNDLNISGLFDTAGNVFVTVTITLAVLPQPNEIVLNEIMFDPLADGNDGFPDQTEFIEFYNRTNKTLSLRNLYITDEPDENNEADTLFFTQSTIQIAPFGFALLVAEPDFTASLPINEYKIALAYPDIDFTATSIQLIPIKRTSLSLTNSGNRITLHLPDDTLLDTVYYLPEWHHPNLLSTKGISLERIDPALPPDAQNWRSSLASRGATPGLVNSAYQDFEPPTEVGITVTPPTFSPDGDGFDETVAIQYDLSTDVALIRVRIFDSNGRIVRNLEEATLGAQSGTFIWNGLDDDGKKLRIGIYVIYLEAVNSQQGIVEAHKKAVVLARKFN